MEKQYFAVLVFSVLLLSSGLMANDVFADDDKKHEKYKDKKKKKTLDDFCDKKKIKLNFRVLVCDAYHQIQNTINELTKITNKNSDSIEILEEKISAMGDISNPKTQKIVFSPYGIIPSQLGFVYADDSGVYLSPSESGFMSLEGLPNEAKISSITCNSENGFVTADLTCELFRRSITDMSMDTLSTNMVSVDANTSGIVGSTNTKINFETIDTENYSYNLSFTSNSSLDIPIRDIVIEFSY